jgi:type II secretory pathway component PulF
MAFSSRWHHPVMPHHDEAYSQQCQILRAQQVQVLTWCRMGVEVWLLLVVVLVVVVLIQLRHRCQIETDHLVL